MPATTNRVAKHIADLQARVEKLDAAEHARLDASMDIDAGEHFAYQQTQARAAVSGTLSTEEAMIVYRALGENGSSTNGGWAKDTDLATKVSVTLLMGELMKMRLAGATA